MESSSDTPYSFGAQPGKENERPRLSRLRYEVASVETAIRIFGFPFPVLIVERLRPSKIRKRFFVNGGYEGGSFGWVISSDLSDG